MRVLHAVTLFTPGNTFGGPVTVAQNLATGLRRRAVDARIVTVGAGFDDALPNRIGDVPAFVYPMRRILPGLGFSGITSPALLWRSRALVRCADVVHIHLARDLVTLPIAAAALYERKPLVLQTHGMVDPSERLLAKPLDALVLRRLLREADVLAYLTSTERAFLEAVARQPLDHNLARLLNGVQAQSRRTLPAGPPLIVYTARLQERKRPERLVEAVPEVLRAYPDARVVLAGPDEGLAPRVRELIKQHRLERSVSYVGALGLSDTMKLVRSATLSVLPSVNEPFPMSVLEALSFGVPNVVTHSNGLARAVEDAGAGRVVRDDNFATAIIDLLDPDVNERASEAAWQLSRATFSIDAILDDLEGLYERAMAAKRRFAQGAGRSQLSPPPAR